MTNPKSLPDAVERVDIAELRALLEKATSGPWVCDVEAGYAAVADEEDGSIIADLAGSGFTKVQDVANAALIVAAVNALPTLLSTIEKLETENARVADNFAILEAEANRLREIETALLTRGFTTGREALAFIDSVLDRAESAEASNASLVGALRTLQDWQPIETAPRDGTHIILAFGQDHSSEGWYLDDDDEPRPWAFIDIGDNNMVIINRSRDGEYGPSHWRAMPYREPRNRPEPGLSTLESGEATAEAKAISLLGEVEAYRKGDVVLKCEYITLKAERDHLRAELAQWESDNPPDYAALREARAERDQLSARLEAVLARDAEWSPSGSKTGCNCINLSRKAEQEYETGKCPHQLARQALQTPDTARREEGS